MDEKFKNYIKKSIQPMRPYEPGEDLQAQNITVYGKDIPELGGMVAVNPDNPTDQWYVSKDFFEKNYIPADITPQPTP